MGRGETTVDVTGNTIFSVTCRLFVSTACGRWPAVSLSTATPRLPSATTHSLSHRREGQMGGQLVALRHKTVAGAAEAFLARNMPITTRRSYAQTMSRPGRRARRPATVSPRR